MYAQTDPHPSCSGDTWPKFTSRTVSKGEGSSMDPSCDDTCGSEKGIPLPGAHVKSQFPRSNLTPGNSLVHLKTGLAAHCQWIALPLLPGLPVDCCCCHSTATASLRSVRASLLFPTNAHTLQVLIHVLPRRPRPHSPYWSPLLQLSLLTNVVAGSSDST